MFTRNLIRVNESTFGGNDELYKTFTTVLAEKYKVNIDDLNKDYFYELRLCFEHMHPGTKESKIVFIK